jgi:hypothetical protein
MEEKLLTNFGGIPEKFKREGVFVHYGELVKIGETVETIRNVMGGVLPKGTKYTVKDIYIDPNGNNRGFTKRIELEGVEGLFNPKRFKKIK